MFIVRIGADVIKIALRSRNNFQLTTETRAKKSSHHQGCFTISFDATRVIVDRHTRTIKSAHIITRPGPRSGVPAGTSNAIVTVSWVERETLCR